MNRNQIIQNYRLVRKLGEGGMGEVWLGEHVPSGRKVAIKFLHPHLARHDSLRARFKQEAQVLSRLQHPGIVALLDYLELGDLSFLVMEYVEGTQLDDYILKQTGPLPDKELRRLFALILDTFQYAHSQKVIHRDIKPGNIIVTPEGQIKVLDFGIAKLMDGSLSNLTKTGNQMGSVLYMSPEQVDSKRGLVDLRSDIYSLGVLLFFMSTARLPYDSQDSEFEVYHKIVRVPLPDPSTYYPAVSDWVKYAIMKATAKQPQNRFQSCKAFKDAMLLKVNEKDVDVQIFKKEKSKNTKQAEDATQVLNPVKVENADTEPDDLKYWEITGMGYLSVIIFSLLEFLPLVVFLITQKAASGITLPTEFTVKYEDLNSLMGIILPSTQESSFFFGAIIIPFWVINALNLGCWRAILKRKAWGRYGAFVLLLPTLFLSIHALYVSGALLWPNALFPDVTLKGNENFFQAGIPKILLTVSFALACAGTVYCIITGRILLSSRAGRYFRDEP